MAMTHREESMEEVVRVAVLELLVNPEIGTRFLTELMEEENGPTDEATMETVTDMFYAKLRSVAEPIVQELVRDDNIEIYWDKL